LPAIAQPLALKEATETVAIPRGVKFSKATIFGLLLKANA
jgi:hypothetical protein